MSLTYTQALDLLYSLMNYERQQPASYTPDVISLERPRQLLDLLGNPQERYPIIHVAGTKGKGSVSAICASILQAAGYKVGFYLSPHLQEFRERFRLNDQMIPPETFAAIMDQIQPLIAEIPGLTFWEVLTAIGFEYFAREHVDIAVIEVGLGGRLDATNVITKPLVAAITNLSYDHMALLGNTLTLIAGEKAGIIKPGVPVVSAPQTPEALDILERVAAEQNAPLTLVGRDWMCEPGAPDLDGQHFTAGKSGEPLQHFWLPLIGTHQAINATVALAVISQARTAGWRFSDAAIKTGLARVNWPGRFEVVRRSPYVILDAAHNGESANRVAETVQTLFPGQQLTLIFGAFNDKDLGAMFTALLPLTRELILLRTRSPRAFNTEALWDMATRSGYGGPVNIAVNAQHAYTLARERTLPNGIILATGSMTVVGELRDTLGLRIMRAAYLDNGEIPILHQSEKG